MVIPLKTTTLTHSLTHGAEPFLRSCQLCSYSKTSQHFMEPVGSLPCLQEPSHPTSLRSILILSIHLRLGLRSGLFPYGFPTNILYGLIFYPIRAECPAHLILLDLIILVILEKGTSYEVPHYPRPILCKFPLSSLLSPISFRGLYSDGIRAGCESRFHYQQEQRIFTSGLGVHPLSNPMSIQGGGCFHTLQQPWLRTDH
jgi:hypothetical protein